MPSLLILQGPDKGVRLHVDGSAVQLGRTSEKLPLTDFTVSRRHAELRPSGRGWMIEDIRSANGTYLNGIRIERPTRLKHGDQIRLGGTVMVWDASEETTLRSSSTAGANAADLIEQDEDAHRSGASIIGSVDAGDDSMILASPAAAEAVRSWRVMSALLDAVGAILSPEQLIERVVEILLEEVPADRIFVLLKDEKSGRFDRQIVRHRDESQSEVKPNRAILAHVIEKPEGILCSNSTTDPRFRKAEDRSAGRGFGLQSVICVPLVAREDVLGLIYVECAMAQHIYTEVQLRLVASIGQMAGLAIEDVRLVDQRMRTERLAATGETVAALSHYIKNILQGMMGGSDVVEMGLRNQAWPTVDQGWQVVQRNLDKIYSLSLNMLAYAKRRTPRRAPVQLNAVVEDVLRLVQRRAADKAVIVKKDLSDMVPAVRMDEDGIHQVALNIINNAVDAVAKRTGAVTVRTRLSADGETVTLIVGDNGPGMTADQRARIFDAFYSTKGHGGTGLGLAVARKIVDEHNGRIDVKSIEGEGTIIEVTLPVNAPGDIESDATHGPPPPGEDE